MHSDELRGGERLLEIARPFSASRTSAMIALRLLKRKCGRSCIATTIATALRLAAGARSCAMHHHMVEYR
jgi:hypothetical protein